MFCEVKQCMKIGQLAQLGLLNKDQVRKKFIDCQECYTLSKHEIAKETSHYIDILFAKTVVDELSDNNRLRKKMVAFALEVSEKNGLNANEHDELLWLLREGVANGNIYENRRNGGSSRNYA